MIEQLTDMPSGAVGFRVSGEVTAEDLRKAVEPALVAASKRGPLHMLHLFEDGVRIDMDAIERDIAEGLTLGIAGDEGWTRWAIVTDVGWVRMAVHIIGILVPGEMRLFRASGLEEAKRWASEPAPADASRGLL